MSEEQIKYQKHYIPLTRDELVERLHLVLRRLMELIQKRQVLLAFVMIMQNNVQMMFLSK